MRWTLVWIVSVALVPSSGFAQKMDKTVPKYQQIQVAPFEKVAGLELPQEYATRLSGELVSELMKTKRFKRVLNADQTAEPDVPMLRVTGTITEFKKGNRATRYFVGFGAGRTLLKARIQFTDVPSGAVILEDDVDGNVVMGGLGGASSGATRGLAKEVAKVAKKRF
jgi:hypothetical protein